MTYYHDKSTGRVFRGVNDSVYTSQGCDVLGEFPEMDAHPTRCLSVKGGKLVLDVQKKTSFDAESTATTDRIDKRRQIMNALTDPAVKNFEAERKRILGLA